MSMHCTAGFHLGFSSRGGGHANATIAELRWAKTCSIIIFPSVKNDIVQINLIIIIIILRVGGSGGMLPHAGKFFNISTSEMISLVASEQLDGESLSVTSTGSPLF